MKKPQPQAQPEPAKEIMKPIEPSSLSIQKPEGKVAIYAENIFNRKYEERFGYPMLGRIIGTSLKAMF